MIKIIAGILGVIIVGAVGYVGYSNYQSRQTTETDTAQITTDQNSAEADSQNITSSLIDLVKLGQDVSCTFESTDDSQTSSGQIFIANNGTNFKGEFISTILPENEQFQGHMISDGEHTYVWSDSETQGIKMRVDPEDDTFLPESENDEQSVAGIDEDEQVTFSCQPWSADQSAFVPPSDIEFVDFSQQMDAFQSVTPSDNQSGEIDCSICDQAPAGEAQAQCRMALGC